MIKTIQTLEEFKSLFPEKKETKQNPRIPNNPPPEDKPFLPGDPDYVSNLMNEFRKKYGQDKK